MTYEPLARKYRPQKFAEVVGQKHITETLRAAIAGGRVAAAYLFAGQRGSGKTTVARIVAKAVNCDAPRDGEPCGKCVHCVAITEGRSLDVLEIDGASNNSVDDVRELRENVGYAASAPGKRKVYVVDEVHMLSTGAFNALLKTLEEPPGHVLFVFATTDLQRVPDTIRSRCQGFDFRRLLTDEIRARVGEICTKEKHAIDEAALFLLAKRADGSMRDGLSLLDQVVSSSRGTITAALLAEILGLVPTDTYFELTGAILERDPRRALEVVHAALRQGADPAEFVEGLVEHFRNLLLLGVDATLREAVALGDVHLKQAQELATRFKTEDLLYLLNRTASLYEDVRRSPQPVLGLEAAVVEMSRFESRVVLSEVLERLQSGGPTSGPAAGGGSGRPSSGSATESGAGRTSPGAPSGSTGGIRRGTGPRAESAADFSAGTGGGGLASPPVPASPGPAPGPVGLPSGGLPPFAAGGPVPAPSGRRAAAAVQPVGLQLDDVASRWNEFAHLLRETKTVLGHCVAEARPVRLAASTVEVQFPLENGFQLHTLQEAIKQRTLDPYLQTFFGQPLHLSIAAASGEPTASPPAARLSRDDIAQSRREAIADVVQQTPAIDEIIRLFDGEVLEDPQS